MIDGMCILFNLFANECGNLKRIIYYACPLNIIDVCDLQEATDHFHFQKCGSLADEIICARSCIQFTVAIFFLSPSPCMHSIWDKLILQKFYLFVNCAAEL